VECLPTDIAEKFDVDVTNLGLDQTLFVRDLKLGDKFTLVTRGEYAVAVVKAPEGADTAQPGAAAAAAEAQPDVIKKGKEEAAGDAKKAEEKK
jgi:large subunit ribosomal protein L25